MENNWKEKIKEIYNKNVKSTLDDEGRMKAFLEFGSLVFEATKKECADKAENKVFNENDLAVPYAVSFTKDYIDVAETHKEFIEISKDSILNIEKPCL